MAKSLLRAGLASSLLVLTALLSTVVPSVGAGHLVTIVIVRHPETEASLADKPIVPLRWDNRGQHCYRRHYKTSSSPTCSQPTPRAPVKQSREWRRDRIFRLCNCRSWFSLRRKDRQRSNFAARPLNPYLKP